LTGGGLDAFRGSGLRGSSSSATNISVEKERFKASGEQSHTVNHQFKEFLEYFS